MEAARTSRTYCLLALGLVTGLLSRNALAIASDAAPAFPPTPAVTATPDNARQTAPQVAAELSQDPQDSTPAQHGSETQSPPALAPEAQAAASPPSTPCLTYFVSDSNQGDPESCAEPDGAGQRLSLRFGRGFATRSGVMGRFDGLLVDYRLRGGVTLNGVAGRPVGSGQTEADPDKQVFGLSATTAKFANAWDLNSYIVQQQHNGSTQSRVVGGALRYLRPKRSLLVSLDYDMAERSLSTFMVSGAWKLRPATTLSATFDVRESYLHTPQEGYLQQTMAATEGWKWALPMDRIKQLAGKRSTEVGTLGLGLSHALSQRFKLSGDVAVLDVWRDAVTADPASGADQTSEFFYRIKLTAKDLVLSGDNSTIDLRHSVTESSRVSSASFDTRYAVNRLWQIRPRLRTDYRDSETDNSVQWVTSPALKMEYRWREQYGIDIEAGGEWSARARPDEDEFRTSYFLTLGYKASF